MNTEKKHISTFSEDRDTWLEDAADYMDRDIIDTFDLSPDDTDTDISEDDTWKTVDRKLDPPEVDVFDVAAYILKKKGTMTTIKLQKLVYYSQVWSLVWDEKPLFSQAIEAWANGPVVRELFNYHRGIFEVSSISRGNLRLLNEEQHDTIDAVLDYYGDKTAQWLIDLTHMEEPWKIARKGLLTITRGNRIIPLDVIVDYYSSLPPEDENA